LVEGAGAAPRAESLRRKRVLKLGNTRKEH